MPDDADRDELLASAVVAHVGMSVDGIPVVIPLLFQHEDGVFYFHGARASRAIRHLASGAPVCVTVSALDGFVASRSAFSHSVNYRSVVALGRGTPVDDPATKRAVLERMTARMLGGRAVGRDYLPATEKQLRATGMAAITVDDWSGKRRTGPPLGEFDGDLPPDHPAASMWAGLISVGGDGNQPGVLAVWGVLAGESIRDGDACPWARAAS